MASLNYNLESKSCELQTMPGLVTEDARLLKVLSVPRKKIENRCKKLALFKEVGYEIKAIKVNIKLLLFVMKAQEYRPATDAQTRQREVKMELLKKREESLHRNLVSAKKELDDVKVKNGSLGWSGGKVARVLHSTWWLSWLCKT